MQPCWIRKQLDSGNVLTFLAFVLLGCFVLVGMGCQSDFTPAHQTPCHDGAASFVDANGITQPCQ